MAVKDHHRFSKAVTRTRRWAVLRAAVLERDGFQCVNCGERRRLEVDHIKPVRTHPQLSFDPRNLQALCGPCHTRKTRLEVGLKPTPDDRLKWRESVNALERGELKPEHKGEHSA